MWERFVWTFHASKELQCSYYIQIFYSIAKLTHMLRNVTKHINLFCKLAKFYTCSAMQLNIHTCSAKQLNLHTFSATQLSIITLLFNLLKPNDTYIYTRIYIYIYVCRTAALTSRRYILNIYSTNIHTEYFKHAA